MRRPYMIVLTVVVVLSFLLTACSSTATNTPAAVIEPTTAVQPAANATATDSPSAAASAAEGMALPDVDPAELSGEIYTAGSSTVYPVSEAIVEMFKEDGFAGNIKLDSVGSGAGFERFCTTGETDIANASRAIKDSEVEACAAIDRTPIEFRVGTDALAIVVNSENTFLTDITLAELAKVYSNEAVTWADVNPEWPAEPIKRYAPGTDSGTFDFFIEAVMQQAYDKEQAEEIFLTAENLQSSEDDNVLVQGVEGDMYAIGFFGYAYYSENASNLKILTVDGVTPSFETAESGDYPLSRPLFIYSDAGIMKSKPQVAAFINYYLTYVNDIITEVGYFPASDQALDDARQAWLDAQQ